MDVFTISRFPNFRNVKSVTHSMVLGIGTILFREKLNAMVLHKMIRDDRHLLLWRFLLLFSLLSGTLGTPPKLVDQSVWFFNDTILNVEYEMAVVHLEFDQDIYLSGETFLCGEAEKECTPPNDCVPCDWSSQEVFLFWTCFLSKILEF